MCHIVLSGSQVSLRLHKVIFIIPMALMRACFFPFSSVDGTKLARIYICDQRVEQQKRGNINLQQQGWGEAGNIGAASAIFTRAYKISHKIRSEWKSDKAKE